MIRITFHKLDDRFCGFDCVGHADFVEDGYDIVCAAVSALTVNCCNSIEKLTNDSIESSQEDGNVRCRLKHPASPESELLFRSYQMGVQDIAEQYPQCVKVTVK